MPREIVVVTGVARHSLGEAVVQAYLASNQLAHVIGIDQVVNTDLARAQNYQHIIFDLNPLEHVAGLSGFASDLGRQLSRSLETVGPAVSCLVQCAGAYDFGAFLDHNTERRQRVLGLNVLGITEVLYGVMAQNDRSGLQNSKDLAHILVGSFQGLYARKDRPIYAPSKAYGIDLCTSLTEGHEVARCMYAAVGPMDTPMLHKNHWVRKAGGSEDFFQEVLSGPRSTYRAIFVDGDEAVFETVVVEKAPSRLENMCRAMAEYRRVRSQQFAEEPGVTKPQDVAKALVGLLTSRYSESGVYRITTRSMTGETVMEMADFSSLDRRDIFRARAKTVLHEIEAG
jgi:short-subunit dehydrogenase